MARLSPISGSGRGPSRLEPHQSGTALPVTALREGQWPAPQQPLADPVAPKPTHLIDLSGSLVRIEGARLLRAGPWKAAGLRLKGESDSLFELFLSAGDGREVVIATIEEDEAIAAWRSLGRVTGLPLIMQAPTGAVVEPYPQIGRVALGASRIRRQYGFLRQRRPRFLVKRKRGQITLGGEPIARIEISEGQAP
jgi:hypothetical protein